MKPGGKICIVTPGALGSNPRVVKEAQTLWDAGYDVTVIATRTLDLVDQRDEVILATARWRTLRLDFRGRGARRFRRVAQLAFANAFALTGHGGFAERGFSIYTPALARAASEVNACLYIAHYPAALPAAAYAARRNAAHYAFDAEDFHLGDYPDTAEYRRERDMIRAIEGRYLAGCTYASAASPGIADAYAHAYGIVRPTVMLNAFPLALAPAAPTPSGTALPRPSVYWFSQTIGPNRGLECAVRALGQTKSRPHLYLRGSPAEGFLDLLQTIANEAGVGDRLHILPPASPSEMERLAAGYDMGLAGEPGHTGNNRIALGNKLFTYLLAGLPAAISDVPSHVTFAAEAPEAVRLYESGNAESLAAAFDSWLMHPELLANARKAAFRLGQARFNWDMEKQSLLNLVSGKTALSLHDSHPCRLSQGQGRCEHLT